MATHRTAIDRTIARSGILAAVGLLCVAGPTTGQSLARIAEAEAARRAAIATPARVLTDIDLASGRAPHNAPEPAPLPPPQADAVEPAAGLTTGAAVSAASPTTAATAQPPHGNPPPAPRELEVSTGRAAGPAAVAAWPTAHTTPASVRPAADAPGRDTGRPSTRALLTGAASAPSGRSVAWNAGGALQVFTIPKTDAERAGSGLDSAAPPPRALTSVLPPAHGRLPATFAVGYVPGADWASELTARGTFYGIRTQLHATTTIGPQGVQYQSGHLSLADPDFGWSAAAGDLFSEIRGLRRGLRLTWNNSTWHQPAVALYMPATATGSRKTVLAYRDEVRVTSGTTLGGEVLSDGSAFARARHAARRWDTEAAYRRAVAPYDGTDLSWFGSYTLWRGFGLRASARRSHSTTDTGRSRTIAVRVPLPGRLSLTYENIGSTYNSMEQTAHAVAAELPIGPVRVMQRLQSGDTLLMLAGRPAHIEDRRLQTVASYAPARWATMALQQANEWQPDGTIRSWQEIQTTFHLGRRVSLVALTAAPDLLDRDRLSLRLSYEIARSWGLSVDYGSITAFQSGPRVHSGDSGEHHLRLMLRKTWDVPVPARGGDVRGRIVDQIGKAVPGAVVRLGRYQAVTNDAGAYRFNNVPSGDLELSLDRETLPADYAATSSRRRFAVTPRTHRVEDWVVAPLNAIHGYVYVDRNENGAYDAGEETAGIVVRLGERATATMRDGSYGFYNLEPGVHTIRLDRDRLPADLVPLSGVELRIELRPSGSATGADFRLGVRKKEIIIQELRRP